MAASVPTIEPTSFVAGDTVKWTRSLSGYSAADGWTLAYAIRGAKAVDVEATTDTDGVGFAVTVSASESAKLTAGQYQLVGYVFSDDDPPEQYTVYGPVQIVVEPNVATAQPGELVSPVEAKIALVEAQIAELLASPTESYSIGGRSAVKRKLEVLEQSLGRLKGLRRREQGGEYNTVEMVFDDAR